MSSDTHRSVCPYDCPDTCGLLVTVAQGRAVRVTGDPDHPYTLGRVCPKMARYERTVHSPRRLTRPLLRTGPKGSGLFREITWDEATATIANRWSDIIQSHGAEAILPYSYGGTKGLFQRNAGHPFFHYLGASRLERTICSPAKEVGLAAVLGETPAPRPEEVLASDLVILWGINAAATSIHFFNLVSRAKKSGARVWLIDTYETPTAALADELLLVRPGSDGALALGIMRFLDQNGLTDRGFLERHVQGFRELREQVLPEYSSRRTAELTGVPEERLTELATAYAAARTPFIRLGSGLSRYGNGAMTVRIITCLPAVVGAYAKHGAGLFGETSTSGAFDLSSITREDFMKKPTRIINMNRLGGALTTLTDPPVKSLYVYHSNPAVVAPDQNQVLRGLGREDLFTVVHERFLTDTARYADIVLPATSSLEHSDLYRSYGTYYIQRARAIIPAVGESRSNGETFSLLAQAMEFDELFFQQSADEVIDGLLAIPRPLREGIDTTLLATGAAVELSAPVRRELFFETPSGKVEILNPKEESPLPRYLPPHEVSDRYPLKLMTAPALLALNSTFFERDDLRQRLREMTLLLSPEDAGQRGIDDGALVTAFNDLGAVRFFARVTGKVPPGTVVAEGVWWLEFAPGERSVNALTSQRLTDQGNGSTFYDNMVDVRPTQDA
jgi:anaerobic selenocysteine-containing dehydrogenase